MKLTPSLNTFLKEAELESILNDALRILETLGVGCNHKEAIKRIPGHKGITYSNGRLHFSANTMRGHLESRRKMWKEISPKEEPPFKLGGCWSGMNYCDPETKKIRPATTEESVQMTKLWEARGVTGSVIPVVPGDVNFRVQTLAAERICLLNSRHLGGALTVISADEARFLNEMYQAVGRRFVMFQETSISPLRMNDESLSIAMEFIDDESMDVDLGGSIPMYGVTTPHNMHAALAQSVAERLYDDLVGCILTPKFKLVRNPG